MCEYCTYCELKDHVNGVILCYQFYVLLISFINLTFVFSFSLSDFAIYVCCRIVCCLSCAQFLSVKYQDQMECDAQVVNESCNNCKCCPRDEQFLDDFEKVVPAVFMSVSVASALSCLLVFITYCSLKRLSGYLPKVLLLR